MTEALGTALPGIRASGFFRAEQDGAHRFYCGGTGAVTMRVDGQEVLRRDEPVAASDVMGKLKRGDADSAEVVLDAGREVLVEVEFRYTPARVQGLWYGVRAPRTPEEMRARAVAAACEADAVVLVVGETSDSSVESKDRPDTCLAADQVALIEAVCAANPRTAVVANIGHAFDASWGKQAAALLSVWYPGEGFGAALAAVLAGDREPGGRLPVTLAHHEADYPALSLQPDTAGNLAYDDGVLIGYRGVAANGVAPLHAFGAGQGYTRFDLVGARVEGEEVVTTLRNTGDRAGAAVVQLYRRTPEFALVGFGKLMIQPGSTAEMRIAVEARLLRTWTDAGWREIPRPLMIAVGFASDDLRADVVLA